MKLFQKITIIVLGLVILSGCSEKVPPAHHGKKITPEGYLPEVLPPGRYWMSWREELVLLDGSTHLYKAPLSVTMRDSNADGSVRIGLDMEFMVSLRYKLKNDPKIINAIFNDIIVENDYLSGQDVFNIYGTEVVKNSVRETISKYTPEEALANRAQITNMLSDNLKAAFKDKPISVSDVLITKMVLPKIISDRIKANKDRELKLAEAQAQQAIDLAQRENETVLAREEAKKRLIDAEAAASENKALNAGLTEKVLSLRKLEIQKTYADAWKLCMSNESKCGSNTIFMPFQAMENNGAQVRMFQGK